MAIASVGSIGTTSSKTAGTSLSLSAGSQGDAGNLVVVVTAWDNNDTTDGATTNLTCSDSSGNTWTRAHEYTETSGAVDDGINGAIFYSLLTHTIPAGGTITVTSANSKTAKVMEAWEFSVSANSAITLQTTAQTNAASGQPAVCLIAGQTSRDYLYIWFLACERTLQTVSNSTPFTQMTGIGTTGGATTDNQCATGGYYISTATTGASVDCDIPTGAQNLQLMIALYETTGLAHPYASVTIGA